MGLKLKLSASGTQFWAIQSSKNFTYRNLGAGRGTRGSLTAPGEKSSVDLLFRKSVEDVVTVSSLLLRVRRFNELFRRGMALPRITRVEEEGVEPEEVLGLEKQKKH